MSERCFIGTFADLGDRTSIAARYGQVQRHSTYRDCPREEENGLFFNQLRPALYCSTVLKVIETDASSER